jgi:hypothetical protein
MPRTLELQGRLNFLEYGLGVFESSQVHPVNLALLIQDYVDGRTGQLQGIEDLSFHVRNQGKRHFELLLPELQFEFIVLVACGYELQVVFELGVLRNQVIELVDMRSLRITMRSGSAENIYQNVFGLDVLQRKRTHFPQAQIFHIRFAHGLPELQVAHLVPDFGLGVRCGSEKQQTQAQAACKNHEESSLSHDTPFFSMEI